jgi:hypothetical protein
VKVRLELREPSLAEDLADFLRRRECATDHVAAVLEVELPHELNDEAARLELDLLLRVWEALHDGAGVDVVS